MYCVGRFKCPSSYCISFDHICNRVCDCPHCEDESVCSKLLCPGMVLIESMGSGLRCSQNVAELKLRMNMRQVIRRNDVNLIDEFPVFLHLEYAMNPMHVIHTPETVVYCTILHTEFTANDYRVLHYMVSVRRLLLPYNSIQMVYDTMLGAMSQLIVLDLSHNFIAHLPLLLLCSLRNLQYISLHHNLITSLHTGIFKHSSNVQVLLLESNNINVQSVIMDDSLPSLYRLTSDIPRLCCAFDTAPICSPPFPLFVSCSNLIASTVQIAVGWLIGLSTSFLNLLCLILLVYKSFATKFKSLGIVMFFSMNVSLAELVTSLCLLSYSVINIVFDGTFGIFADQWRHSWKCVGLESLFSVSSRASCAFAGFLSIHFAIHIPSITKRKSKLKTTVFQIILMWFLITSICVTVQVLELIHNIDPSNYFCFPFTTVFPSDPLMLSLQTVVVLLDILLVMVTIVSYGYLLMFTIGRRRNEALQSVDKRRAKLQKVWCQTGASYPEHCIHLDTYSLCTDSDFITYYNLTKNIFLVCFNKFSSKFGN